MKNISYHASGFLLKAKYSAYFSEYFEKLDCLSSLVGVSVFLVEEIINGRINLQQTKIQFSNNLKYCTINILFGRYYHPNTGVWSTPSAKEVFDTIDQIMMATDQMHKDELIGIL